MSVQAYFSIISDDEKSFMWFGAWMVSLEAACLYSMKHSFTKFSSQTST